MKELSLDEIKTIALNITETIHNFCIEKGVIYSVAYGTMLGAIRHKGIFLGMMILI